MVIGTLKGKWEGDRVLHLIKEALFDSYQVLTGPIKAPYPLPPYPPKGFLKGAP